MGRVGSLRTPSFSKASLFVDFSTLLILIAALAVGASAGGLIAGLLGVGGGIIFVPVLLAIFDFLGYPASVTMHLAVATSLTLIILTSYSSIRAHHAKGKVDVPILRAWVPYVIAGAIIGGILARFLDGAALKGVFGVVALLAAANLMMSSSYRFGDAVPTGGFVGRLVPAFNSFISTLMGVGGGTLNVPTLTAFGAPMHMAVGTAAAFGMGIALPGAVTMMISGLGIDGKPPLTLGYVNFLAVAIMAPLTMYCAPWGAKLAHALPAVWLRRVFAAFLVINGIRMLWGTFA